MVGDPREEISRFVRGMSILVRKEYRSSMLYENIDISCLMVYAEQIEEDKLKERIRR